MKTGMSGIHLMPSGHDVENVVFDFVPSAKMTTMTNIEIMSFNLNKIFNLVIVTFWK